VKAIGEAQRELVKDVGVATEAGEKEQHWAAASPIKIMQANTVDADELTFMRGLVHFFLLGGVRILNAFAVYAEEVYEKSTHPRNKWMIFNS